MKAVPRNLEILLREHVGENRQMILISGPRQVGKTTLARSIGDYYFDWDNFDHRETILRGPAAIAEACDLHQPKEWIPVIVFDELHKYQHWRDFLKGFFDVYEKQCRIIVTGSAKLDVFGRGGDSLVGRYFHYHMHPFSVAELSYPGAVSEVPLKKPQRISETSWENLVRFGGFPEPLVRSDARFYNRWNRQRLQRLLKEDLRDLTRINEVALLESLTLILSDRSGQQLVYASLAKNLHVSPHTIKAWVNTLNALYFGFLVRPWHRNVRKALRKEPKWYLRDWSGISDLGRRAEGGKVGTYESEKVGRWERGNVLM